MERIVRLAFVWNEKTLKVIERGGETAI